MNEYQKEITDKEYENVLSELFDPIEVCGSTYDAGYVLRLVDETAFRCSKLDYEDGLPWICGSCAAEYDYYNLAEDCCIAEEV